MSRTRQVARPVTGGEPHKAVTFQLPVRLLEEIDRICREHETHPNRSEVLRVLLEKGLKAFTVSKKDATGTPPDNMARRVAR